MNKNNINNNKSPPTLQQLRQQLRENTIILSEILSSSTYPQLSKLLTSHACSLYNKLQHLHSYALSYGTNEHQVWSIHPVRGFEFMGSLDTFVKLYRGSKQTWSKSLEKFRVLGLLMSHKPRENDPDGYFNTDIQDRSVERAKARKSHEEQVLRHFGEPTASIKTYPVTWHRIPAYTPEVLQEAENRVPSIFEMGSGINKDAICDIYGSAEANRITDTGYSMHPETITRREALKTEVLLALMTKGYTTSKETLCQAMLSCPGYPRYRWEETWKAYKPLLRRELHLRESRPTNAEKKLYGLISDAHIMRKVLEE